MGEIEEGSWFGTEHIKYWTAYVKSTYPHQSPKIQQAIVDYIVGNGPYPFPFPDRVPLPSQKHSKPTSLEALYNG